MGQYSQARNHSPLDPATAQASTGWGCIRSRRSLPCRSGLSRNSTGKCNSLPHPAHNEADTQACRRHRPQSSCSTAIRQSMQHRCSLGTGTATAKTSGCKWAVPVQPVPWPRPGRLPSQAPLPRMDPRTWNIDCTTRSSHTPRHRRPAAAASRRAPHSCTPGAQAPDNAAAVPVSHRACRHAREPCCHEPRW